MVVDLSWTVISAGVGVVVVAGIYVLWGPDHWLRRRGQCPGLLNLGNTCFLNAVLQALASLPTVRRWLNAASQQHQGRLALALDHTLTALTGSGGVLSPAEVMAALAWHYWRMNFEQQDAHELYQVLLTTLDEETIRCPGFFSGVQQLLKEPLNTKHLVRTKAGNITTPERPLVCPLQGLLTSELICCSCHFSVPTKCEWFSSLCLTLPPNTAVSSLQACLLDYVKSEVVYSVECPRCSQGAGKRVKRTFMKQLQLGRAPECLCIHLKRTVWLSDGSLCKDNTRVSFPARLDISTVMKVQGRKTTVYELGAVIEHVGSPLSGHYITYRQQDRRHWACTSDTSVYAVGTREVLSARAYMLFYNRETTP